MNQDLRVTYELVQTKVQNKAAKQTEKSMKKLTTQAAHTNAMVSGAAGAMAGALAAVGGAMFLTVGAASKFEDSFAGIRKTVDATEAQFSTLALQVRQLAQDIPVAVTQLNQIGELGGQLGVGVENLEEFIEVIAQVGVATRLSTESAALSLARLDQIFGLQGKSFDRLASSLVDLGNNFAALEDEILSTALRLAAAGKVAGATAADVLGIATALQAVGVQSQAGGTAMARVFQQIQIAVATGGRQLEVFAETTGLTTKEFQDLAKVDPASALNLFVTSLASASKAGTNVIEVLDQLGLKQQRTIRALLAVGEAEGLLTDTLATANSAFEANIALTTEAEKRFETFKSETKLLMNELTELRIQIGNELLPTAKALVTTLSALIGGFQNTSETSEGVGTSVKVLFGIIVSMTAATAALGAATKTYNAIALANGITVEDLGKRIKRNAKNMSRSTKTAKALQKTMVGLRFSMIGLGLALAAITVAYTIFTRRQEAARRASESFLANRAAVASITEKVADKEKELQDLINSEDMSEARLDLLRAELDKLREIEEQIKKKSMIDFFKQAGIDGESAEEAQKSLNDVGSAITDFYNSGLGDDIKVNVADAGLEAFQFNIANEAASELNDVLKGVGLSLEELSTLTPDQLLDTLGLLEAKGVDAFRLYSKTIEPIVRTNTYLNNGVLELNETQEEQFKTLRRNAAGLEIIQQALEQTDVSEKALKDTIQENVDAYNELDSRQDQVAISLTDVLDGTLSYVDLLKALDGEQENSVDSAQQLAEATFALSDQVTDNINKFRDLNSVLQDFGRIAPMNLNQMLTGMEKADERADFLRTTVISLAKSGFVPLSKALTDLPLQESIGLALTLTEELSKLKELEKLNIGNEEDTPELIAQRDIIADIQNMLTRDNPELRSLTFNDEQLKTFITEQERLITNTEYIEKVNNNLTVQAEGQLELERQQAEAALQIFNIARQEEETKERIADLQEEMVEMTADIVANGFVITQQQIRQLEVTGAQEQFAEAIAEFGKEGVVTNNEQLAILQAQLNLQRMRDKIEGTMSNRDKIRIRDKKKEIKFLEMAVEQGVAEQLDLDAAKDELSDLENPISDAELAILNLQEKIADAQLKVLEGQKKRLDPSVVEAIKAVAAAQSLEADAVEKYADKEHDLAEAMIEARLQTEKNALIIDELTRKYPGLQGIITELAKDIGIPESILQSTLDAMTTVEASYKKKVEDMVLAGRTALFDIKEITNFIDSEMQKQAGYFNNLDINYTPPVSSDVNKRQYTLHQFGERTMNNYTGGNVPIGRTSIVGERGPEVIMSTPGGTSVFSNKTGGGMGGINVAHMDVNITGLPADPLSARKAAINIRKELMKLEKEGTSGTGLRNR